MEVTLSHIGNDENVIGSHINFDAKMLGSHNNFGVSTEKRVGSHINLLIEIIVTSSHKTKNLKNPNFSFWKSHNFGLGGPFGPCCTNIKNIS